MRVAFHALQTMSRNVSPGTHHPLGATPRQGGVNFALFSEHAERVNLCLFDSSASQRPSETIALEWCTDYVHHVFVEGIRPGQVYGYRVEGPWDPVHGHRFDPNKVLLDPYARVIARKSRWGPGVYSYHADEYPDASAPQRFLNGLDSAATAPLGMVSAPPDVAWDAKRPRIAWSDTLIYELHVRGFTRLHPEVPPNERGTYKGLASDPVLEHLQHLGVTAVELLPVQHFVTEDRLEKRGLRNYWGYQPLGYFAPEPSYSSVPGTQAVAEFQAMVRRFHEAGIEVILDVVFNHTGELGHDGPTLSFRGIDNASYYRLDERDPRKYLNYSGCGNTLRTDHPPVVRLVIDSLQYWIQTMGVDGFRFDLAATLGRTQRDFDRSAPLLAAIAQASALDGAKLIAEPWDLKGEGGDQLGQFPETWSEWNRCFRDDTRRYWLNHGAGCTGSFATRIAGSSDIFSPRDRGPRASINFVTAHDGFTLADLVTYGRKRNLANGENDQDGDDWNHSWNCGLEGPTTDAAVLSLRARQRRNLLATLMLSQGVPMLTAGDEFGRTQRGNNNAYCQDNEISWVDWSLDQNSPSVEFVRSLVRLRNADTAFRRERFFQGLADPRTGRKDVHWVLHDGTEISPDQWSDPDLAGFGAAIAGETGNRYLLLFNPTAAARRFVLPGSDWHVLVDTWSADTVATAAVRESVEVREYSLVLLTEAR